MTGTFKLFFFFKELHFVAQKISLYIFDGVINSVTKKPDRKAY